MSTRKRTTEKDTIDTNTNITESENYFSGGPTDEPSADAPSFADRVGRKDRLPFPDPFGIDGDYVAGVRLLESKQDRQMAIKFGEGRLEDKPSQAVIDKLKEAGYRWNPANKIWAHPLRYETAYSTRVDADRVFKEVCQMIRQEKGIETDQEVSR